nr:ORF23 [Bracoviriform inaniti]
MSKLQQCKLSEVASGRLKELDEIDAQSADKWKEHPIRVNHRIIKLKADKERLQAELRFMCRKIVMLSDDIIEALRND